jgi:hypothetical protein
MISISTATLTPRREPYLRAHRGRALPSRTLIRSASDAPAGEVPG